MSRRVAANPSSILLVSAALLVALPGCGRDSNSGGAPDLPSSALANQPSSATANAAPRKTPENGPSSRPAPRAAPDSPNVVLFLVDTLRAERLGPYGYTKFPTSPALDELTRHGVVFEHAYAPAPWTAPSVASLFTSTFVCEHSHLMKRSKLAGTLKTLAERLLPTGYTTYGFWANSFLQPEFGLSRGFMVAGAVPRMDGEKLEQIFGKVMRPPMFLYIHTLEPHNPDHFAPDETPGFPTVGKDTRDRIKAAYDHYKELLSEDYAANQPPGTTDRSAEISAALGQLNALRTDYSNLYDAAVRLADGNVGSTINELKRRGLWDRCVFIFVSDHGEEMGEHGGWLHSQALYEEQIRVPLVIRFPNDEHAGLRISTPVSLVDVAPTILELAKHPELTDKMRGQSLMPLIRGEKRSDTEPTLVSVRRNATDYYRRWHEQRGENNLAARWLNWKAIWNVDPQTLELYDLLTDPGEQKNIAADFPEVAARIKTFLVQAWENCSGAALPINTLGKMDDETKRRLKSIGYVE